MRDFGEVFEQYILDRLTWLELPIILGKKWKKIFKDIDEKSAPDFTVPYEDCTVFIEVKSKEFPQVPKVFQSNDSLEKNLNDTITKGVMQIFSLANQIRLVKPEEIKNTALFYGMVVTYKDHFLKGGAAVWDEFLGKIIENELKEANIPSYLIPPENFFFISVAEYDYLSTYLKNHPELALRDVLESIKKFEATPETQAMTLGQHLENLSGKHLTPPPYLDDRFEEIPENLKILLKKQL
jgi:hypothetical protein